MSEPSREVPAPGFAGDTGDVDPTLAAALAGVAADPGRHPDVLAALHAARVLAPVTARSAPGTDGEVVLALLTDGAGARALPVFSCLDTLARWDPAARPVPVEGPRAAAVVVAEGATDLVLDVAGPVTVTLGDREVRALLRDRPTIPTYDDDALMARLRDVLRHEPAVQEAWLGPWPDVDARLTIALDPAADPPATGAWVAERLRPLAESAVLGLDLALVPAGTPPPAGHRPLLP